MCGTKDCGKQSESGGAEGLGIFARQIGRQGYAELALRTICATLISEICKRDADPVAEFAKMSASLASTAGTMAENALLSGAGDRVGYQALEETFSAVLETAENMLSRDLDLDSTWRRERVSAQR